MSAVVLAIDTSTEIASVALCRGDEVVVEDDAPSPARHDHVLLARIDDVLRRAGVSLRDVTLLAVGLGPGAFGGLRVGLATIKGLAIATRIPVVGVTSLHALAASAPQDATEVLALADAHRGEVYGALFRRTEQRLDNTGGPSLATLPQLAQLLPTRAVTVMAHGLTNQHLAVQSAWPEARIVALDCMPAARHIARHAQHRLQQQGADDPARLLPIYIRDSDAKLPAEPLLLAPEPKD